MNRPGWKFWTIAVVALLWNLVGAVDYLMTQTRNEAYMSAFTPEQLEFFYGLPAWTVAAWAIGVWGSVVGSILLLLRKRAAVWAFAASLAGVVVTAFQNFVLASGLEIMGGGIALAMSVAVFVIAAALLWYSRSLSQRGILA
jgi:hypothetical protein